MNFTHGSITLDDLIQGALNADAGCRRVISDAAVRIGTVVAQTCISMDPQSIVIGGSLTKAHEIFLEPLQQSVQRLLFPDAVEPIRIIPSDNPEGNVVLGAALSSIELASSLNKVSN